MAIACTRHSRLWARSGDEGDASASARRRDAGLARQKAMQAMAISRTGS
jgi:hypothetical protein